MSSVDVDVTRKREGTTINSSIPLGRFAGIGVRAHWSAALIAILIGSNLAGVIGIEAAIVGTIAFLVSILLHEFGHALTARRFGVATDSIQLWALGGVARLSREPSTPKAEGWIAVAGPLTSVAIAVATLGSWWALDGRASNSEFVALLAWLAAWPSPTASVARRASCSRTRCGRSPPISGLG